MNRRPTPRPRRDVPAALGIAWALPASAIGALLGALVLAAGGSVRRHGRVLEFSVGAPVRRRWPHLPLAAITFGHVVLGTSPAAQDALRDHERVHVRQYERLGPLFLLAYPAASLAAWWRGDCPYRGNRFEAEAFACAGLAAAPADRAAADPR